ncbi:MAG: aldehyde:ferredoxin oxidoreductase [Deltaproteobacteria bacterium]|nr:aldehyde:ferredoxin oxidoreductase [Deltaproteobacteria bacterium]
MKIIKSLTYNSGPIKGGYTDQILQVDLDSYKVTPVGLPPQFKEKYIGGRGYTLKLIWDGTSEHTRYDSPENLLVMASGPLGNEPRFPGSGKFIVGTISPLTDTFVDSNIGGHFGPLLKLCGFDALAVSGISERGVVLIVDADKGVIEIVEAPSFDDVANQGALSYGDALLREFNDGELNENIAAVTTGIGASNARFGIINSLFYDRRRNRMRSKQAGRGGTGTVMSLKGLKAVIVRSSRSKVGSNNPVDDKGVKQAGANLKKVISQADPQQFRRYFTKKIPDGCYKGCNLACAKAADNVTLKYGPQAGKLVSVDGPEYETAGAVTCMGIFDPQFIVEYNWYCDEYGLDTISMGVTSSFLMECVQRGYLKKEDTGYELGWGNIESADRLLHETALGKGFGKICGQGVHRVKAWVAEQYAGKTGLPIDQILIELDKFAMETKGLEFSMYITKESLAQQGGYGFALKGPQHDEAWLIFIDQVHKELPTFEIKAKALKWFPLIRTWFNAVGLCKLPWIDVRHPEAANTDNPAQNQPTLAYYVQNFNATVGCKKTLQDILDDSERLHLLQKMINLRHGKGTRASDRIPLRAMAPVFINEYEARPDYYDSWLKDQIGEEKLPDDPQARHRLIVDLRKKAYEKLCDAVYEEKGYTPDAIPLPETLEKFDLMDEQARTLLVAYGLMEKERLLSN